LIVNVSKPNFASVTILPLGQHADIDEPVSTPTNGKANSAEGPSGSEGSGSGPATAETPSAEANGGIPAQAKTPQNASAKRDIPPRPGGAGDPGEPADTW
jgi:hypothetical protein